MLTILGPEFAVGFAAGQRANAKRGLHTMRRVGYSEWTLRHSFYANMGGFILQARDSTPFPIHGLHLIYLLKEGYLNLPEITSEDISDKSKANLLAKALVCLQTGWFVVQCLGRLGQGLPITTLELITISYVWCTWAIYAQWLNKPLDVATPMVLKTEASMTDILRKAGPAASDLDFVFDGRNSWTLNVQPFSHFLVDPRERPMPRILNDSLPWLDSVVDTVVCIFVIVFYGAIHMFGWNLHFPTSTEQTIWRLAALVLLCSTAAFCISELLWGVFRAAYLLHLNKQKLKPSSIYYVWANKIEKIKGANELPIHDKEFEEAGVTYWHIVFIGPLGVLYVFCRLYVLGEALAALRALPSGCFQNVHWTTFIPHL